MKIPLSGRSSLFTLFILAADRRGSSSEPKKDKANCWNAILFCAVACAVGFGCERQKTLVAAPNPMNWTNLINTSRSTIISGDWMHAEQAWMDLSLKKDKLTDSELKFWLQFQTNILQETRSDPLKEEIRIMAVQEIGMYPKLGIEYRNWIRDGLATNFYTEQKVQEKAQEVLKDLDRFHQ